METTPQNQRHSEHKNHREVQSNFSEQLHPKVIQLLKNRNIHNDLELSQYLSWDLKLLPDLSKFKDIKRASERLTSALMNGEKFAIYGDYDVDGTTSCALFYHFFSNLGELSTEVTLIQPSRFVEGYGLHVSSIDDALAREIKVLVTVDCGITNNEAAAYAKEKHIDLIITDHHKDAREDMPDAYAIVNPNRRDELEPELHDAKSYAGVMVAFCVCVEIRNELLKRNYSIPSLYPLLQFVAIGTICDLAYLNTPNKILVRHGLKQLKTTEYVGLKTFLGPNDLKDPIVSSEKLAFHIGPLINAKGRLEHPEAALKLLTTKNSEMAMQLYEELKRCNAERKAIQNEVFKEAKAQFQQQLLDRTFPMAILHAPHWHEGVIGIVASKIVESFGVPAMILTDTGHEGVIKGSCRTAGPLDLFELLKECEDLFLKFGGHKAAAGLSMNRIHLNELRERLYKRLNAMPAILRSKPEFYDLELDGKDIGPKLVKDLGHLEPFGMGNHKPKFLMKDLELKNFEILKDGHVKWTFKKDQQHFTGISFSYLDKPHSIHPKILFEQQMKNPKVAQISATFQLSLNRFNNSETIQLLIEKVEI